MAKRIVGLFLKGIIYVVPLTVLVGYTAYCGLNAKGLLFAFTPSSYYVFLPMLLIQTILIVLLIYDVVMQLATTFKSTSWSRFTLVLSWIYSALLVGGHAYLYSHAGAFSS